MKDAWFPVLYNIMVVEGACVYNIRVKMKKTGPGQNRKEKKEGRKGRKGGRKEGKEEGREAGREEGTKRILREQMEGPLSVKPH